MAKSLRSKRERKLRKIKRIRYGKKELQRLKTMLGIENKNADVEMKNIEEQGKVKVRTTAELKTSARQKFIMREIGTMNETVADLEDGTGRLKNLGSVKTFVDEKGNFPEWMPKRTIRKLKRNEKRDKRKEKIKRKKEAQRTSKSKKLRKAAKLKKRKQEAAAGAAAIEAAESQDD